MTTVVATDAYEELRQRVLAGIKTRKLDPEVDTESVSDVVRDEVQQYQRQARSGMGGRPLVQPAAMEARLLRSITDYGPLTEPLTRPDVEEIFIKGGDIYVLDGNGRLDSVAEASTESELLQMINRLLLPTGRHVDQRTPMVQARVLSGKARLGVVIPPISDELSATVRRYTMHHEALDDLVEAESICRPAADLLAACMQVRAGIIVSGQPGAGKTTLVNALVRAVPASHRVLGCEETRELSAPLLHGCYYQTRPRGSDGTTDAEVSLRELVKLCLGMRPDVIVVGEVRGSEAYELTRAANAGCGVVCTIHANSAREALQALTSTAIMAGENVPAAQVRSVFASTIDLVVHLDREDVQLRESGGRIRREVMEIIAVPPVQASDADYTTEPIFVREEFGAPLRWTKAPLPEGLRKRLERVMRAQGRSLSQLLHGFGAKTPA